MTRHNARLLFILVFLQELFVETVRFVITIWLQPFFRLDERDLVPEASDKVEGNESLNDQTNDVENDLSVKLHLHSIFPRSRLSSATKFDDSSPLVIVEDLHDEAKLGESQHFKERRNTLQSLGVTTEGVEGESSHDIEVELYSTSVFLRNVEMSEGQVVSWDLHELEDDIQSVNDGNNVLCVKGQR